jgi:hypothetical protein
MIDAFYGGGWRWSDTSYFAHRVIEQASNSASAPIAPVRLVDLDAKCVVPIRQAKYIAVSYVWSQWVDPWVVVRSCRPHAERTNTRYLWIDALCIDQKDEQDTWFAGVSFAPYHTLP